MESPKTPVFLLEGHDLAILDSVTQAEAFLEPQDAVDGSHIGYDAEGRRLSITVEKQNTIIRIAEEEPTGVVALEGHLREHLIRLGEKRAADPGCGFRELVDLSRQHSVFSPIPLQEAATELESRYQSLFKEVGGNLIVRAAKPSGPGRTKSWELYAEVDWEAPRILDHAHAEVFRRPWFSWRWTRIRTLKHAVEATDAWLKNALQEGAPTPN